MKIEGLCSFLWSFPDVDLSYPIPNEEPVSNPEKPIDYRALGPNARNLKNSISLEKPPTNPWGFFRFRPLSPLLSISPVSIT